MTPEFSLIHINTLNTGERAKIAGFKPCHISERQRLLAMGLTPGASFTIMRTAPLGDPIEIRIRGFSLCIRQSDVSHLKLVKNV